MHAVARFRGPCNTGPRARRPTAREIPRALALLQNSPRTSPKLQLSPNDISPSLKPSHLTPWLSWNFPVRTLGDSVHGDAAGGDTA